VSRRCIDEAIAPEFEAWLESLTKRAFETLTFREIRKGAQALVSPGVTRGPSALSSAGKRAAMFCYFAPLEFIALHHVCRTALGSLSESPRRVVDLACGCGAGSAAIGRSLSEAPRLIGVDRNRVAVDQARGTWRAFGLDGRLSVGDPVRSLPPSLGPGDVVCHVARPGGPDDADERRLVRRIAAAARRGATILLVDVPALAGEARLSVWRKQLGEVRTHAARMRITGERPRFLRDMEKAGRLTQGPLDVAALVSVKAR
jgi:hypothetical protein